MTHDVPDAPQQSTVGRRVVAAGRIIREDAPPPIDDGYVAQVTRYSGGRAEPVIYTVAPSARVVAEALSAARDVLDPQPLMDELRYGRGRGLIGRLIAVFRGH